MSYDPTSIFLHCIKFTTDFISMGPSGFFVTHFNCNDNTFYEYGKWSSTLENREFMTYITHFFHLKCWCINTFKVLYISNVGQIHNYSTSTSISLHCINLQHISQTYMGPSRFFVTHFNCNDNTIYAYGKWSSTLEMENPWHILLFSF